MSMAHGTCLGSQKQTIKSETFTSRAAPRTVPVALTSSTTSVRTGTLSWFGAHEKGVLGWRTLTDLGEHTRIDIPVDRVEKKGKEPPSSPKNDSQVEFLYYMRQTGVTYCYTRSQEKEERHTTLW